MHETYFAAANSGAGFVSYYADIFHPNQYDRLYLIKGGPGTGKSSLMRRVAAEAEKRGISVRRYACSSDPDSLDGVVVGENKFAMLDSTAPHTQDTMLPGAGDELIDLGQFWNTERLSRARREIIALNQRKKMAYTRAYDWLCGVQACEKNTIHLLEGCVDYPKLRKAVRRYLQGVRSGAGNVKPALIDSIGMRGRVCFDSMQSDSTFSYILTGTRGGGDIFLREVAGLCGEMQYDVDISRTPTDPTRLNALCLRRDKVSFIDESCAAEKREQDKAINMERFWLPDQLRIVRGEVRQAARCREQLMKGAELAFADAREAHFAIEQIYIAAMDFAALNDYCNTLIERIFSAVQG